MDFSRFEIVSFDCYGTLIDWETGILRAVRSAFPNLERSDGEILAAYSELEPAVQARPYRTYRMVLREVLREISSRFNRTPSNPDAIADLLGEWQPFPDTLPALTRLKQRYKLAIISNIDDDLFAATADHLQIPFD